jgi:RND superfamily putative drug exporter
MILLIFCIAFGLSMDYEVFLLARIKEAHDAGADTVEAVATGLARTGRIVTTAAALLAITFMRLAGQLNWWSPPVLRRLYQRIGRAETAPPAGLPATTSIPAGRATR